jgi:hypothetical protein
MNRDIDPIGREDLGPARVRDDRGRPEPPPELSRERRTIQERGYTYQVSPTELETMRDIGRFRAIAVGDLARHRYPGNAAQFRDDLRSLRDQGLVQRRTAWTGANDKLSVLVLTKQGKAIVERERPDTSGQKVYAGFVKPAEVAHDTAIYRMYQAEARHISAAGGRIRRIVLDFELKQKVYSPLAKAKGLPPLAYARKQAEVARQNGLTVIAGKIPLPDLRIEYETRSGEISRVDLELATSHYHGGALEAKAEAGFKMYSADGSASHLSRVLEERDIMAEIFSL